MYRDFGDFPASGFLAEYYVMLGNTNSLTVSGAWDNDLLTGFHDFTLSFDTEFSISDTASLGLSGSRVLTDGGISLSEALFEVTFARENGSFGLSASKSLGDYRDTTFAVEWVSRW